MSSTTFESSVPTPTAAPDRPGRRVRAWLAVVILAGGAVVGSNTLSIRDRLLGSAIPDPVVPATSRVAGAPVAGAPGTGRTSLRSAPWWQTVTTVEGTGSTTSVPFSVDRQASEWRVTWACTAGRLLVRDPGRSSALVDAQCPQGVGHASSTGATTLEVTADGPWRLEVAQRIDIPLVEPPLAAMTAPDTKVVGTGSFSKVDRVGTGTVTIYDQADGRYSVRLDDFWVTSNASLQLRLSTAESPRTTEEYVSSRSQLLSVLDVTAGSLNYVAPAGVDAADFRSVVIWNPSENSAYAAAPLEPPS